MSEPITLAKIRIEAFRGFRDAQEVDLDASVVVLTGANGTGKTSLIDAIQWLLLGRLERLEPLRPHRNDEHIVNHYRLPGPASVEADIRINGRSLHLKRTGRYESSVLEVSYEDSLLQGRDADEFLRATFFPTSKSSLRSVLLTSGLLQQDVMRSLLEASSNERYQYLNELLDLGVVERFEEAAKERLKERRALLSRAEDEHRVAEEEREARIGRVHTLEAQIRNRPGVTEISRRLSTTVESYADVLTLDVSGSSGEHLESLLASIQVARSRIDELAEEASSLENRMRTVSRPSEGDIEELRRETERLQALVDEQKRIEKAALDEEHVATAAAEAFAQLASQAIPFLGDNCPVCRQSIDRDHVAADLRNRAAEASDLVRLRERLRDAENRRRAAEEQHGEVKARLEALEERQAVAQLFDQQLQAWVETMENVLRDSDVLRQRDLSRSGFDIIAADVRRVADALREVERVVDLGLVAFRSLSEAKQIDRIRSELGEFKQSEGRLAERVEVLRREVADADALVRAAREAGVRVVAQRFDLLRPLVADIYGRLDPHPSFKNLDLDHEVYRAKGATRPVVRDPSSRIEANPSLVFSTSQANIAALSYFLALGWAAGDRALPFICLDDPLQSMDDVNVLAFADLCRFIRSDRQLIISTHESRFANLLERKLAPRAEGFRTLIVHFAGWDRSGPSMNSRYVPSQVEASDLRFVQTA